MVDKRICSVCGKKIKGFNDIPNVIGDSVLCSSCYEKIGRFKINRKYNNREELLETKSNALNKAKEYNYPISVQKDLETFFTLKEKEFIDISLMDKHILTTGCVLEGYHIDEYLGVVVGQYVIGSGFLSDFNATFANLAGSEAVMFTDKLDEAKNYAQNRAIYKSLKLGGNALIGIDVDYTTFCNTLMGVIFSGTSVKVTKL